MTSVVIVTKLCDPYDYNCHAYDAASESAHGYDFLFTLGFNAPYDYDCDNDYDYDYDYWASLNRAYECSG